MTTFQNYDIYSYKNIFSLNNSSVLSSTYFILHWNGIEQQAMPIQALPVLLVQGIHSVISDFDSNCILIKLVTFSTVFKVNLKIILQIMFFFQELISLT